MARTNNLTNFLTDVADAIREKKGTEETIQASDFDTEIASIESGADISEYFDTTLQYNNTSSGTLPIKDRILKKLPEMTITSDVTNMTHYFSNLYALEEIENIKGGQNVTTMFNTFYNCQNLKKISFNGFDGSKLENIGCLFLNCINIENIDLSSITSQNINRIDYLFGGCQKLKHANIPNLGTTNVTLFYRVFQSCYVLESIDVSNFDTSNATNMEEMFYHCNSLTTLDLSNFVTPNLTTTKNMFAYCSSLMHLDIRKMTFDSVTNYLYMFDGVPANCEIIVKSQTEKEWITSNFSRLTNVKTVEEYEAE